MVETCELAVIGAGPAGMTAAIVAAQHGVETMLFDEQPTPGGQIYRAIEQTDDFTLLGEEYRKGKALSASIRASAVTYVPNSIVWQASPEGRLGILDLHGARMLHARRIILATGAMERPVCIPGWTLPGVMGVGAAQTLLKASGLVPDVPTVISGSGPLIYLLACQLARAGVTIAGVCVTTPASRIAGALTQLPLSLSIGRNLLKGVGWIKEVRDRGIPMTMGAGDLAVEGTACAEAFAFTAGGKRHRIAAGLVLLHEGVIPNIQLTLAARLEHVWDEAQYCWRPVVDEWGASSVDTIAIAGDGSGIAGAEAAEARGHIAALDAACRLGRIGRKQRDALAVSSRKALVASTRARPMLDRAFAPLPEMLVPRDDSTIVCRCENVTARALREAVALGGDEPNRAKIFTRCGMGPCQGRMCGPTVAAIIANQRNVPVRDVGTYRIRVPVRPLPLAALAQLEGGEPDE